MEFGVVGRMTDGFFPYQAWPTVAKDEKGVIYAASSGHRLGHVCPFGKNYLYKSYDDGRSWEGPIIANDTYMDDRDAGLCAWGDGNLLLSWFSLKKETFQERMPRTPILATPMAKSVLTRWEELPEGQYDPGSFVKISHDGGKTWSGAVRVPVTSPHGPIRRRDGSLLYFGKVYLWNDEERYPNRHICAIESRDDGKTWLKLGQVSVPEGCDLTQIHEPHVVELSDGTLLGGIRCHGSHINGNGTIFTTISRDVGKTWSKPCNLGVDGYPPHFLLHTSGAIVLTYGRRLKPFGERAMVSCDGGKTWSREIVISPESPDWDLGYPSSVELSDGSVLTVYYQKYPGDSYNSILYTRWQLPEPER